MNVENAVKSIDLAATVVYVDQMTLPADDPRRGWPAPTVLVDGRDLFGMPEPATAAMSCRTYAGGAPSEREIVNALESLSHD